MAKKGSKLTEAATQQAEATADELASLGDITTKKMFGGYGVFEAGTMFVLIDSSGTVHFRVSETSAAPYSAAGSHKHSRMPYWTVPDDVLSDPKTLLEWATTALTAARDAKKK